MKTPEEIIAGQMGVYPMKGQIFEAERIVEALDAAGYVIVPKGEDTLSPEMAEKIVKEATTQLRNNNVELNRLWHASPERKKAPNPKAGGSL